MQSEAPSRQLTEIEPIAPTEPTVVEDFAGRMGALSDGFALSRMTPETQAIGVVGGDGQPTPASDGVRPIEGAPDPVPSYRELMNGFNAATTYAIEINLVGSVGSTMTGSMSKLMSGN